MFDWFKSSNKESATQQPTWNPNTMTMQQPSAPEAPVTEQVVTGQPVRPTHLQSPLHHKNKSNIPLGPARDDADGLAWWW